MPVIEMTGKRFGRLTVIDFAGVDKHGAATWICKCDCGNITKPISGNSLRSKNTQSCGCLYINSHTKHGMRHSRLYSIWQGMKARCYRQSHTYHKRYGGRGISVCDEWKHDFQSFYDWAMSHGYSDDLTIDRVDVNGNYCPENCRWVSMKYQHHNKGNTIFVDINGTVKSLSQWADFAGLKYQTVYRRYAKGERGVDLICPVDEKKSRLLINNMADIENL